MNSTTVILRTGGHCIETSAKIEFRRLTDILLEPGADNTGSDLENKIELLLHFLENSDFNALRASDERLAGIIPADCIIKWDENSRTVVVIPE